MGLLASFRASQVAFAFAGKKVPKVVAVAPYYKAFIARPRVKIPTKSYMDQNPCSPASMISKQVSIRNEEVVIQVAISKEGRETNPKEEGHETNNFHDIRIICDANGRESRIIQDTKCHKTRIINDIKVFG